MAAKSLTPQDAYSIINLIAREATGQNGSIQAVNSSTFVSVGETLMSMDQDTLYNALSRVLGRTFMAVRPYDAPLKIINSINSGLFTDRMRKISFYAKDSQASGAFNTNMYTQHATGLDNGVNRIYNGSISPIGGLGNMYEQNLGMPLEINFSGRDVWDDSLTIPEVQAQQAFRGEGEFLSFMNGIMTEKGNDIEQQKEAFNRMTILNFIAGVFDLNQTGSKVDLKAAYNTKFGTSYTSAQLLSTYKTSFLQFFVSKVKTDMEFLKYRSKAHHVPFTKTVDGVDYSILRHTPKDRQRLLISAPFIIDAEASVFSEIFHPNYLDLEGQAYEKVAYWQNYNNPTAIDVTPAIPNLSDPTEQTAGSRVQLNNVLGVLYDADAMLVDYQLDSSASTPLEARKMYRNLWWHFAKNSINDFSENAIVYYLGNDT